jgi:hypothetical protein
MVDKDFYIEEIGILDWMINDKYQKIRFKDRIEYRVDSEISVIKYNDDNKDDIYYLNGVEVTEDDFKKGFRNE